MLQKTEGVVINTIKYSDNSIIAKIFTSEFGLLPFIIRGSRGKKTANKAVLFQPLTLLELDIYFNPNKNFQTIKETRILYNLVGVYSNIHKITVILFIAEVLQKTLKENFANPSLYILLKEKIELLNEEVFNPNFHLYLLIDLAAELGFNPFNNYTEINTIFSIQEGKFVDNSANHFGAFYINTLDSLNLHYLLSGKNVLLKREERISILNEILKYFQFHNPGMPAIKSIAVLQEVF